MASKHTGRRSILTPDLVEKFAAMVSFGVPLIHAAANCGISLEAVMRWMHLGRGGSKSNNGLYVQFQQAVDAARARGSVAALGVNHRGMQSDDEHVRLKAAHWFLEHVFPEYFAKNRIEVTGKDGGPVEVSGVCGLVLVQDECETMEDWAALAQEYLAKRRVAKPTLGD